MVRKIVFAPRMVQAILAGLKTQARTTSDLGDVGDLWQLDGTDIQLEITDKWEEPLQSITLDEIIKEGIDQYPIQNVWGMHGPGEPCEHRALARFMVLWRETYPEHPWESNPTVHVYSFHRKPGLDVESLTSSIRDAAKALSTNWALQGSREDITNLCTLTKLVPELLDFTEYLCREQSTLMEKNKQQAAALTETKGDLDSSRKSATLMLSKCVEAQTSLENLAAKAKDVLDAHWDMSPLEYARAHGLTHMSDEVGERTLQALREEIAEVATLQEQLEANSGKKLMHQAKTSIGVEMREQCLHEMMGDDDHIPANALISADNVWWCHTCACVVQPEHVTYEETHDPRFGGCGYTVVGLCKKSLPANALTATADAMEECERPREDYQTLLEAHTEMLSPSARCQKYHLQACHACDRADCGDNTTPSVVMIRQAWEEARADLAKRDAVIKGLVDVAKVLLTLKRVPFGVCGQTMGQGAVLLRGTVTEQFIGDAQAALDAAKEINND